MKVIIKNMVCERCIMVVNNILQLQPLDVLSVELGAVVFKNPLTKHQMMNLNKALIETGLELLDNVKSQRHEKVKKYCLLYLNQQIFMSDTLLSQFLSDRLNLEYSYLSRLLSTVARISIEQYYIELRIEKVKELISYEDQAFSEIAYDLGFSSVAHLSKQFKKITGITLSEFKKNLNSQTRRPLDHIKIV